MLSKLSRKCLNFGVYPLYAFSTVPSTPSASNLKTPDLEKIANIEYVKYPNHLSHYDHKSPNYIESERDDYNAKTTTDSYNNAVD
jgi:hypothetical protein